MPSFSPTTENSSVYNAASVEYNATFRRVVTETRVGKAEAASVISPHLGGYIFCCKKAFRDNRRKRKNLHSERN